MKYLSLSFFLILFTSCKAKNAHLTPITIGQKNINVEIADTPQKRQQGLMHRKKLNKDEGMLFIFTSEQTLSFWMKNTYIPLSIAYINKNCNIIDIQDMYPLKKNEPEKTYPSKAQSQLALEVNLGWFKKNNINLGDQIKINSKKYSICKK